MTRFVSNLRTGIVVAVAVGLAQALVETALVSYLYADYILTPSTFFNLRMYDAYAKLYSWVAESFVLPPIDERFYGLGAFAKIPILPPLLAVNLAVGVVVGVVLGAVATLFGGGRDGARKLAVQLVLCISAAEVFFHLGEWTLGVHLPVDPSIKDVVRNFARNFLFDGTAVAVSVVLASLPLALLMAAMGANAKRLAVATVVAAALAFGWMVSRSPVVHARPNEAREAASPAVAPNYNVILISIDSLRSDHLSAYGYERDTSPTIKALADQGVLFRHNSSTTAWTLPGHMSMLTGKSLLGHGVISDDRSLTPDVSTMAESFRDAGYATHAIVSAPYVEQRYGFGRGFDSYDDHSINFATHGESYKSVTAPLVQQKAEEWLGEHSQERFFLFLHYWDVHYDYSPGPPYDKMFDPDYRGSINGDNFYFNPAVNRNMDPRDLAHIVALYDGEIRLVDDHLAMLRGTLARLGVADRTILIVTADHGDEFFEHGRKGHHRTLYDEILRVPLVIYVPGVQPTRSIVETETSIIDIMPTALSLTGIDIPVDVEGTDLVGVAFGAEQEWDRATLSELYRLGSLNVQTSLRRVDSKVIHHFNRRLIERYDLAEDPGEQRPDSLAAPLADSLLGELTGALNVLWPTYYGRVHEDGVNDLAIDDETQRRLEKLGYLED